MVALNPTSTQPINDHYGPLISQHVKTILESGLLLDEDYEVLLNASNFKIYPSKSEGIPFGLVCSGLISVASVFIARKYQQPMIVLPPLAATLVSLYRKRKELLRTRRHQQIVSSIIKSMKRLRRLYVSVIRYMKMRNSSKQAEDLLIYEENVKEFINYFTEKNESYFRWFLEQMEFLVEATRDLSDDYQTVKQISIESLLTTNDDNYELLSTRVQDVNTFLSSKYLNYLGLTLCKNFRNIHASELEILLDKKLPYVGATLDGLSAAVQKEFNNLRYCTSKKLEIDSRSRSSFPQQVSGKLQQTLIGAVNNLSIIMEKSRAVLEKIEDIDDDKATNLEGALGDLRDHAYATYESLDVLCKLYGILNTHRTHVNKNTSEFAKTFLEPHDDNAPTVNYDDCSEAVEENYELFIPETEEAEENHQGCEDQAGMYLSLMLKELRQSLRQHERFVAARSKRGIEDDVNDTETPINKKGVSKKIENVPKFDLKALDLADKGWPVPAPRASKLLPPPPPPPPPPSILVEAGSSKESAQRTLLDNVRGLSSQLKGRDEVFGDDCSSDSD